MIYEVTLTEEYFGQTCVNRWNYLSTGTPVGITGAAALLRALGFIDTAGILPSGTLGGSLQGYFPSDVKFLGVLSKAIREAPTDFFDYAYPAGTDGAVASSGTSSPTQAYGFFTSRVRTDVARGTKRLVGVLEENVGLGGEITDAFKTTLNGIASLMNATVNYTDDGNSLTFAPIICGKEKYTVPVSGKDAYRYWPTISEQLEHTAQGIVWTPYAHVRTQVSRQYKHGA